MPFITNSNEWADDSDDYYPCMGRKAFNTGKMRLGKLMDEIDKAFYKVDYEFVKVQLVVDHFGQSDERDRPLRVWGLPPLKDNSQLRELKMKLATIKG